MRSLAGKFSFREVIEQRIHHRLYDPRGVGGGGVAMHPALRVDDVADGIVGAAHREARRQQILLQRFDLGRVVKQELDVIAAGEAQMAAAILVRQVGE